MEGVTVELLKVEHSSDPRNKTIARFLSLIGYIERGVSTFRTITGRLRTGRIPDPQFHETGNDFVVTFSRSTVNTLLEHPEYPERTAAQGTQIFANYPTITR